MKAIILGASPKKDRYSYMALMRLKERGYDVFPVNPSYAEIEGITVCQTLAEAPEGADVLTIYLNPHSLAAEIEGIIPKKPKLVIFNPGTEDASLQARLSAAGVPLKEACTLVLLSTKQL